VNGRKGKGVVMKTFVSLSAVVIGLALAGPVAATPSPDAQSMPPRNGGVTSHAPWSADESRENPRLMTGRVLKVDAQEGTLVIQTPIGVLALRGPSEDLRGVSVGDVVEVEVIDDDYPSASPPMLEEPERL
jgi:hypothetical protein